MMELFYKLAAVLLFDTCKLYCIEEDLPSAMVTMSLPPLVKAILNSFLLIKGVVLVAKLYLLSGKPHPFKDGFAFTSSLSVDVFSEEDSVSLTHCNGDKRWDTADHTRYKRTVQHTGALQIYCQQAHTHVPCGLYSLSLHGDGALLEKVLFSRGCLNIIMIASHVTIACDNDITGHESIYRLCCQTPPSWHVCVGRGGSGV